MPLTAQDGMGADLDIGSIIQIARDGASAAKQLLVVSGPAPNNVVLSALTLGTDQVDERLVGISVDVRPFGVELQNGNLEVVAANVARTDLTARQTGAAAVSQAVGQDLTILAGASIGGRLEDGHIAAYGVAELDGPGGTQELVTWLPFAAPPSATLCSATKSIQASASCGAA